MISSNEQGLLSLQRVHAALRHLFLGSTSSSLNQHKGRSRFNPMKEYCNVGVAGVCTETKILSQQKLMALGEHLDHCSECICTTRGDYMYYTIACNIEGE